MDTDFLRLASTSFQTTENQQTINGAKDSVLMRSSGSAMQWSFSNKVSSATPQLLSFKADGEEKHRKSINDISASSATTSIPSADAFDSNKRPYSSVVQKNMNLDKQGANHYAPTSYGAQHLDAYSVHRTQQMGMFPVSNQPNQTITLSMNGPALPSHAASNRHNMNNSNGSQSLGALPINSSPLPSSVHPVTSSVVGSTELRNGSKSCSTPAQMTIFYAGSVCVYDDISPEKAQAIMLLAGNGSSGTHNKTPSPVPVQSSISRPSSAGEAYVGNKIHNTSPCSGLPITHNKVPIQVPVQASIPRPSAGEAYVGNKIHNTSPCSGLPITHNKTPSPVPVQASIQRPPSASEAYVGNKIHNTSPCSSLPITHNRTPSPVPVGTSVPMPSPVPVRTSVPRPSSAGESCVGNKIHNAPQCSGLPVTTHNKTPSPLPARASIPRPSAGDSYSGNEIRNSSPCSGLPSSISVSSSSTSTSELPTVKPVVTLASTNKRTEPTKAVSSAGPASTNLIQTVAVPQARKASLARFLEKRKERAITTSPYNVTKKSADSSATESDSLSLSINSLCSPSHQRLAVKGGI